MASEPTLFFEIGDIVSLTSTKGLDLVGCVLATDESRRYEYTKLRECVILLHSHVSIEARRSFLSEGIPPRGHVFVESRIPRNSGSSLVRQTDLILLQKDFKIGDYVHLQQQNDTNTGVVRNIEDSSTIEPLCISDSTPGQPRSIFLDDCEASSRICEECTDIGSRPSYVKSPHDLRHDVPADSGH